MFKTIDEALNWIVTQRKNDAAFSHFVEVMDHLDNPQDELKIIHVTGTNGKGSTIAFLRDLLMSAGFKVGTLQSPHYLTHLDRIRINAKAIEADRFLNILNQRHAFFLEENLNMFEMDYIIMCDYFRAEKVDYALVEVGIGGRLDSTNVVHDPLLSAIVSIGFDHTDRLGDSLEKITYEKCGIIKEGHPVVIGDIESSLVSVIQAEAEQKKSPLYKIKEYKNLGSRRFAYRDVEYTLLSFAEYQKHNASLALEIFYRLAEMEGFEISVPQMQKAIASSVWQGRFEQIGENPMVIVDGAHNLPGIAALCESLDQIPLKKAILFSALKRKEYQKMIELLNKHADYCVLTQFNHPQVMNLDEMTKMGFEIEKDFKKAFTSLCEKYECVVVCGSLYFVSEFMEYYSK